MLSESNVKKYKGITAREYFAGQALNALILSGNAGAYPEDLAAVALIHADAMIEVYEHDDPKREPQPSKINQRNEQRQRRQQPHTHRS